MNLDHTAMISRGEVYYITSKNDTVGSEQKSGRPAVVVSNKANNVHSTVIEICYLTLQEKTPLPTHVFIDRGACFNSTILCEQITTISKERVGDYMCTLPDDIMEAVDKALVISLGLDYIIEFESNRKSSSNYEVVPDSIHEELDKLRAELNALEAQNKELISARDSLMKKIEGAETAKLEARLYKGMYDHLFNIVLGK